MVFNRENGGSQALSTLAYRIYRALEDQPSLGDAELVCLLKTGDSSLELLDAIAEARDSLIRGGLL